jgi:arylsulfatase A-like enzyme
MRLSRGTHEPGSPMARWVVMALTVGAVGGCRPTVDPPMQLVHRLTDAVAPLVGKSFVGGNCKIGDERRPAFGCTQWTMLVRRPTIASKQPMLLLPLAKTQHSYLAQVRAWGEKPGDGLREFEPIALPKLPVAVVDEGAAPGLAHNVAIEVWTRAILPEEFSTDAVDVPPGAQLTVGVGIDDSVTPKDVASVEFRLIARLGETRTELLHDTVRPGAPEAPAWRNHTASLGAFAGQRVHFLFETKINATAEANGAPPRAVPLWGAPQIVMATPPTTTPGINVVVLSFDTLRADHVGAYGSALPTTPNLDRFAGQATLFAEAHTTFPTTTAAHMSMLTGLYPRAHQVRTPVHRLANELPTLAEQLGRAGFVTGAVTEDAMVCANCGFPRGFDYYRENHIDEPLDKPSFAIDATFGAAQKWLDAHSRERFFLFVQTYAVHWPYVPPERFNVFKTFRDGDRERPLQEAPRMVRLQHLYSGEVLYADSRFGELMKKLRDLGIDDRTLVVVTSDHGEEFGEHGRWAHGESIYGEVLRVPLIVRVPNGSGAGRRITTPVSLVDVVPTVLDYASVPVPANLDGQNQRARIEGGAEDPDRVIYAEALPTTGATIRSVAAITGTSKWIQPISTPTTPPEMYDLATDRAEQHPLEDPTALERGARLIAAYEAGGGAAPTAAAPVDPATAEKLKALGYTQ